MSVYLKFLSFFLPTLLGITFIIPMHSSASVPKPAGVVTQVAGQATLHRIGLAEALPVKFRDRVFLQDKIHTQEKTFVRVLLGGKALVTVRELSVLTITEDLDHATIDIQSGIVGLSVARKRMKPGEYIEIRTPHAIAAVRGTTVLTQVTSLTNMAVLEGFIDIAGIATPTQTVQLTQLTALSATGQGLGQAGKMSPEAIAQAQKQLQTDDSAAPGDSPLSDSVANNQSDQAAALAEALAPATDGKGGKLQTEKSDSNESNPNPNSTIPSVLTTKNLDQTNELVVPPTPQTFSTGQPQTFDLASFSGGEVNGTDSLTVTEKTTVNNGTNTVKNSFNNVGGLDVNEGSISFDGGGTQSGAITTQANTKVKFGGGEHIITGNVTGSGTIEVSAGTVNVNSGTYNITGNSTTISGGMMTINAGAALTSLGPLSLSGGLLNLLSAEAVSLPSFNFSGGTLRGTDTVTVMGATTVTGAGTKTVNTTFNNQGPLTLQGGVLRLLGNGTHTGSFSSQAGTTLEFGGGTHDLTGNVTGPGTVNVSAGIVNVNGGTYNVTGNSTTVSGGTMTFNVGATLTSLGAVSIRNGGLMRIFADATHTNNFSILTGSTLDFAGGIHDLMGIDFSGLGMVNLTGGTFNTTGTTTMNNAFDNQGTVNVNEGLLTMNGGGTHTGNFATLAGTTLEFGGGTHDISGDVTGPGTVEVSAGAVNVNGGTYDVTGNSTTVSGGMMTINAGATLTSLGPLSLSGGLLNLLSAEAVALPSFNFSGGTLSGTDTVTVTGATTVTGAGTKTINTTFNNQGALALQEGTLRLLGGGTHSGSFTSQSGTTLEFGGGTHQVAAASLSGTGTVNVTGGDLTSTGKLFSLSGNLTTQNTLFQQTGGTTSLGSTGTSGSDAFAIVGTHILDATGTTDALFDISGGEFSTDGNSSDLIEVRPGVGPEGGSVKAGGSALVLRGTGSMTFNGTNSSILQSVGTGTTITTGDTAISVSGNALLDLDSQTSNDVVLLQSEGSIEADGSIFKVSDSAEARVGRSVGRLESGGHLTTKSGGHVFESTGGTTSNGNSILDMIGSTSRADISGYVVHASGGRVNGPAGFNLVDVDAGTLTTGGGIIHAEGDDRIVLATGTTDAIVDITSSDGTHDLGAVVFDLKGNTIPGEGSTLDTPLTKKDGDNDMAVDQTLLRTSGATVTAKKLLVVDQALLDATAKLFQFLAGSDVTVDPGVDKGALELTMLAKVTSTMPLLTLDNSNLEITSGHLLTVAAMTNVTVGTAITSANLLDLNNSTISILNGLLADVSGTLTVHGLLAGLSGTSSITVNNNIAPTHTIGGYPVHIANGGTITTGNGSTNLFVNTTDITVAAGGSLLRADGGTIHIEGEVGP
jgi:FecR protein